MPWSGGDRLCPGDGSPGLQGLPAVQNDALETGLAAADVTRSMCLGEGQFEGKAHPKLRIVTNLYPEGRTLSCW
ncbi:hypothetical protein [Kiloniella sp. b19]|uniref:hypothetical protein n=1 Tax=Kiloniella sp. GXU_MW_B19 TaxID=3141326 RepID=UPI0031E315E4